MGRIRFFLASVLMAAMASTASAQSNVTGKYVTNAGFDDETFVNGSIQNNCAMEEDCMVGLQLMRVMGVQIVVVVPIMMETLSGEQQVPNTLTVGTLGMIDVSTFPK